MSTRSQRHKQEFYGAPIGPVDPPAIITSPGSASVAENSAFTMTLTADESVTWKKLAGADMALFTLVGATLSMTAKDFEAPADADGDNVYVVTVGATDAAGNQTFKSISVTVTNVAEGDVTAPTITSPSSPTVLENAAFTQTLTANEAVTWSKVGGADQAAFSLAGATLSMIARDFEAPADADHDNIYVVQVRAVDAAGNGTNQTISVRVTDVAEAVPSIALIGTAQHGIHEYPGNLNYNFSVVLGAALAGRRIVFGVHGAGDLFEFVRLDPAGLNVSGVFSDGMLGSGGNYIQVGYVDVPSGASGTMTLRFTKFAGGQQYDSAQAETWVVTGHATGAPKAADAAVDETSPYQPLANAGTVAANDAIFVVSTPFDINTQDGYIGLGGETMIYSEGPGGTYAYAKAYTLKAVGGTYPSIQASAAGVPPNNNLGIGVVVLTPNLSGVL